MLFHDQTDQLIHYANHSLNIVLRVQAKPLGYYGFLYPSN